MVTTNGALNTQPDNVNMLSPLGFNFSIKKMPHVNYFVQSVNIPSVQLGDVEIPNPFIALPMIGDHLRFGELQLSFKVDEDMQNYVELFNWITELGFPESFEQSKHIYNKGREVPGQGALPSTVGEGPFSDATLTILNSAMNPNLQVQFEDCYPLSLSDVQFTSTAGSVDYLECVCSFRFKLFRILRLGSGGVTETQNAPVR